MKPNQPVVTLYYSTEFDIGPGSVPDDERIYLNWLSKRLADEFDCAVHIPGIRSGRGSRIVADDFEVEQEIAHFIAESFDKWLQLGAPGIPKRA
jgi:hypothetical protein